MACFDGSEDAGEESGGGIVPFVCKAWDPVTVVATRDCIFD